MKARVLFLCTHNSARSQMAEGYLRHLAGDRFEVASAGTEARGVHPLAVRAMAEDGVNISTHSSKTMDRFLEETWDYVVTVCDHANEACPLFPRAATRMHWSFDDPASASGSDEKRMGVFRRVRDEIKRRVTMWLQQSPIPAEARSS
jgi:arsenate reductase (thioredoxin)